jgi:hypothetical protein
LVGSFLMGSLYDKSLHLLVIGAMTVQILAIPIFFAMRKEALAIR